MFWKRKVICCFYFVSGVWILFSRNWQGRYNDFASSWWCLSSVYRIQPQKINNFWAIVCWKAIPIEMRGKTWSVLICDVGASHPLPLLSWSWTQDKFGGDFSLAELTFSVYSVASRLPHMFCSFLSIPLISNSPRYMFLLHRPMCVGKWFVCLLL